MKKRLLIFHPYLTPYRNDLYNALNQIFNIDVLLTADTAEINTLGYNLNRVNAEAKFSYLYYSKGFYLGRHLISNIYLKRIRQFKPNIIISHELGINTLVAIFFKKIFRYKIFTTIDDSPDMAMNYGRLRSLMRDLVVRHIDCMLLVNPEVKSFLDEKYQSNKCEFIYFPIIQSEKLIQKKIQLSTNTSQRLLRHYNLEKKKIILFVGRLIPAKSPDVLLQSFAETLDHDSFLVIVGDGPMKKDIELFIQKHHLEDRVLLTGQLSGDELYAWYGVADVFVLPSKFEPFGAVVNEALVAGCHVIVSKKVGASCLVNSTNGELINPEEHHCLSTTLKNSINKIEMFERRTTRPNKMNVMFDKLLSNLIVMIDKVCQ